MSYTQMPEDIGDFPRLFLDQQGERPVKLTIKGRLKSHLLVRVEGVQSREQAEHLRNLPLYAPREDFRQEEDEDDFYIEDLVGMEVQDNQGNIMGVVKAVHDFGAGDIIEIQPEQGISFMVGFTKSNIPLIDRQQGYLICTPPELLTSGEGD